ncbi:hypothetical protein PF003_g38396 [Phytophthora fragariae]|nr:hypothetical protein PF003_g38396 [Phytophthora fragariae]
MPEEDYNKTRLKLRKMHQVEQDGPIRRRSRASFASQRWSRARAGSRGATVWTHQAAWRLVMPADDA